MRHCVGIDLGASALRAVLAGPDGAPTVSRTLPLALADDGRGGWVVGPAALGLLLTAPSRVMYRWPALLAPAQRPDAPRQRLAQLLSALGQEMERAAQGPLHAVNLAAPSTWARDQRASLQHAAADAGLPPVQVMARADTLALARTPAVAARVAVLTLDAEGIDASLFELAPGAVHPLQRARAPQYTLDALDDLLFGMHSPQHAEDARVAAAMSHGDWRSALLRGDAAPWDDDGHGPPHPLTLAQRAACIDFFADAAVAQLRAALHDAGCDETSLRHVVLADVFGEAEAFRAAIAARTHCPLVRAHPEDAAAGAARLAHDAQGSAPRWVVRPSQTTLPAAPAGLRAHLAEPSRPPPPIAPAPSTRPPPATHSQAPPPRPSSVPPARPSEAPLPLPQHGTFVGTPTPAALLALPDAHPPKSPDGAWSLPLLLLRLERARLPVLRLTLRDGHRRLTLQLEGSRPTVPPVERTTVRELLGWAEGRFDVEASGEALAPPVVQWSVFGFLVEAMQAVLRGATMAELESAFAPHRHEAPHVAEHKAAIVRRMHLSDREQRMIVHELDGRRSLDALLQGGSASPTSLLQLLGLLGAWHALVWAPPPDDGLDPRALLRAARAKAEAANHFQVLGLHWSVGPDEVAAAWARHRDSYGPASPASALSAADAAALLARGEAAYEALRSDVPRVRYIRSTLPDVPFDLLAPLVQARALTLSMQRGAEAELADAMRLLRELSPELAAETLRLVTPKR